MNDSPVSIHPGLNVLVVDDDPFMLELIGSMLKKLGINRCSTAQDGAGAVAMLDGLRGMPDLVITDLNMPGTDGFQLMEALASQGFKGGVILLSGMNARTLNSAALMGRFHNLNLLGVVTKPASRADLSNLIRRLPQAGARSCAA